MQQLEATIAVLAKRDEQPAANRVAAQSPLDREIKARQHALLSGDLEDQRGLDKLQSLVDTAYTLAAIDDALSGLNVEIDAACRWRKCDLAASRFCAERISPEIRCRIQQGI